MLKFNGILWILLLSSSHYNLLSDRYMGSAGTVFAADSIGDHYTPRKATRRIHNLPHLNTKLQTVDNTFAMSAKSSYNDSEYMTSLVVFPSILGAIGLIVLLGYMFGMLFRWLCCCCTCCNCCSPDSRSWVHDGPKSCCWRFTSIFCCCCTCAKHVAVKTAESHSQPDSESNIKAEDKIEDGFVTQEPPIMVDAAVVVIKDTDPDPPDTLYPHPLPHRRNHDHRNLTIIFLSCVVIIISFNFTILKGNTEINRGVTRGIDAVDFVGDIFQSMFTSTVVLVSELLYVLAFYDNGMIMIEAARDITDDLESSEKKGCTQASIIANDVSKYIDSTEEYLTYVRECALSFS
jgi:hypothetical protein